MTREEILTLRDLVSVTVENLVFTRVDVKKEIIIVNMPGKEIKLPVAELQSHQNSARRFINYLKDKLGD